MKKIKIKHNTFIMLDDVDYVKYSKFKWWLDISKSGNKYAYRKDKNNKTIRLHQLILGKPIIGFIIDHKNGNGLDCRRKNLRFVTRSFNAINTKKIKGYYYDKKRGVYRARIQLSGKNLYVGSYTNALHARKAVSNIRNQWLINNQHLTPRTGVL